VAYFFGPPCIDHESLQHQESVLISDARTTVAGSETSPNCYKRQINNTCSAEPSTLNCRAFLFDHYLFHFYFQQFLVFMLLVFNPWIVAMRVHSCCSGRSWNELLIMIMMMVPWHDSNMTSANLYSRWKFFILFSWLNQ